MTAKSEKCKAFIGNYYKNLEGHTKQPVSNSNKKN